jgi:hypothetical protein
LRTPPASFAVAVSAAGALTTLPSAGPVRVTTGAAVSGASEAATAKLRVDVVVTPCLSRAMTFTLWVPAATLDQLKLHS